MTEAQAAWLRKLRDEGPQKRPHGGLASVARKAFLAGLVEWDTPGVSDRITPAGLAALQQHEEGKG